MAGDLCVDLAGLAVDGQDLLLEVQGQQGNGGHHHDDQQGQPPVEDQHDPHAPDDVGGAPEDVHQAPGKDRADLVGVAHHPGHNGAHRGGVVIGEGEGLQVGEQPLFQIPAQVHLHLQGRAGEDYGAEHLGQHHGHVAQGVPAHPLALPGGDEVVHRVAGEQGVSQVAPGADQHQGEDDRHVPGVGLQKGEQLGPGL